MTLKEKEFTIRELLYQRSLLTNDDHKNHQNEIDELEKQIDFLQKEAYIDLTAYDHVYLARKADRANIKEYISHIFDSFIELHGDRYQADDHSIVGGLAYLNQQPVTIVGHLKGRTVEENLKCNFGMSSPQGYRKALRLMRQAEKFNRPIITFVDTPGAYPGLAAEETGIGEAIARNLLELSNLSVPIIVVVIGEGGSGGALALSIGDRIVMLEHTIYSVLSPEGFASILWKDQTGQRVPEAAQLMKLTAQDLYDAKIIDTLIKETTNGKLLEQADIFNEIKKYLCEELEILMKKKKEDLLEMRYKKYRSIGEVING